MQRARNNNAGRNRRNNNQRRRRNVVPRRRATAANSVSHRDYVQQRKTFTTFSRIELANASEGLAFGLGVVNLRPNVNFNAYFAQLLATYAETYEQYRLSRIRVYVTPGKNYTNDIRIKSQVACRVDTDGSKIASSPSGLADLIAATNCTVRMLPDASSMMIADYNPICQAVETNESTTDGRQLPPALQWLSLKDINGNNSFQYHQWHGCVIALMVPDEGWSPATVPALSLKVKVDMVVRGRVMTGVSLVNSDLTAPKPDELTGTQANLRTNLLNGTFFPIDFGSLNVANINGSVTDQELIGCKFRVQADSTLYEITSASSPPGQDRVYGANSYTN